MPENAQVAHCPGEMQDQDSGGFGGAYIKLLHVAADTRKGVHLPGVPIHSDLSSDQASCAAHSNADMSQTQAAMAHP